jgi:hypothetical protein
MLMLSVGLLLNDVCTSCCVLFINAVTAATATATADTIHVVKLIVVIFLTIASEIRPLAFVAAASIENTILSSSDSSSSQAASTQQQYLLIVAQQPPAADKLIVQTVAGGHVPCSIGM